MKTFLKIAIPVALLLFVVAPGVTGYLVGSAVEKEGSQLTKALEESPMNVVQSEFKRGWFGSEQTMELGFDDPKLAALLHALAGPEAVDDLPTLLIETSAAHGLVPMANPSKGGLKPALAQAESKLFLKYKDGQKAELPVTVYSSMGAGNWAKVVAEPVQKTITMDHGRAAMLNFEGGTLESNVGDTTSLDGDFGKLSISSDDGTVDLQPFKFNGKTVKTRFAFPESEGEWSMPSAKISAANGMEMSLENLNASGSMKLNGMRAETQATMRSGAITLPGFDIDSTDMEMNYDVDAEALSQVYKIAEQQRAAVESNGASPDPGAMFEAMNLLMSKGGSVNLERFNVGLNGSQVHLGFNLDVPPGQADALSALRNSKGGGEFLIPQDVVDFLNQVRPEIGGAIEMGANFGFIEKRGDSYSATVEFENGVLSLNDLPIPLPF